MARPMAARASLNSRQYGSCQSSPGRRASVFGDDLCSIIIAGISIPVINAIVIATELARVIVSIIAMIIFFSVAISQVHKYEEKWIQTSAINEGLSNEKDFFDNNAGSYSGLNDDEKHKLLVERARFIIQDELSGNLPID
jgi:Protein of unknown function (DUF4231)